MKSPIPAGTVRRRLGELTILDEPNRGFGSPLFPENHKVACFENNGGRDRDRTCDPLDVNEVLSR